MSVMVTTAPSLANANPTMPVPESRLRGSQNKTTTNSENYRGTESVHTDARVEVMGHIGQQERRRDTRNQQRAITSSIGEQ